MGKPTGFLIWGRQTPHKRSEAVRVRDCDEFVPLFDEGVAREQGGRCMDCGVPFCMQGCPLGNRIPDWNDLVHRGDWWRAWVALDATNNFPEFTGRLCPAPCEAACVLAVNQDPVTIELIEKQVVERAFAEGWVVARPPRVRTGKSVGVVGSGPAGLAAAVQLNRAGHQVVVYERADRRGGLLRYGIPDFKLDKAVIDRRLDLMRAEGVRFEVGVEVGRRVSWAALRERHDALVVAIGAEAPRELEVPGRELAGVHLAMDYLGQHNRRVAGDPEGEAPIVVAGERVVVLGGGDTGSDCVGTAHRQGAASVVQLELLPAPPAERPAGNPWPQWPLVLRTSSSHEEGGERLFGLPVETLRAVNGLGTRSALPAGHALLVPAQQPSDATADSVVNTVFTTVPSGRTFYHTVRHGETISVIARRYGVSAEDLKRWNGMTQNVVKVGQRLRVTTDVVTGGKSPRKAQAAPRRVSGSLPPAGQSPGGSSSGRAAAMARTPRR